VRTRKLAISALLAAVALTIFVLEAQIPLPLPIPGAKPGLSNIVTIFALFILGPKYALAIVVLRIVLGNIFAGQMMALFFSLAGGLLSFCAMALVARFLPPKQVWVAGVIGGIAHNIGQMAVALALTQTAQLLLYAPLLLLCGIIAGIFTGLCAQLLLLRRRKL
jgi:heptaprenyl diphosphate synthase